MRKTQSQFNYICTFINSWAPGSTFTSKQFISAVGHTENTTWWKRNSGNKHYICHQYKGYLGRAGFIKNTSRGFWRVEKHIPSWFTLGHLQHLLGYNYNSERYMGLTIDELRQKLNDSTAHVITQKIDTISPKTSPANVTTGSSKLPKMRSANQEVYRKFLEFTKTSGKTFYETQALLYATIEKIKFPYVKGNDTQNKYSGNNYDTIISHLMADGYITYMGSYKNRKRYKVNIEKSVNNTGEKIVTNSTYGYKTENHPIMKTATIQKIDHKESEFFNEPTLSTGDQKIDIAVNIGVLESAKAVLSQFTSNDTFERARVYNVMAQIEHISKELQDKTNLI